MFGDAGLLLQPPCSGDGRRPSAEEIPVVTPPGESRPASGLAASGRGSWASTGRTAEATSGCCIRTPGEPWFLASLAFGLPAEAPWSWITALLFRGLVGRPDSSQPSPATCGEPINLHIEVPESRPRARPADCDGSDSKGNTPETPGTSLSIPG